MQDVEDAGALGSELVPHGAEIAADLAPADFVAREGVGGSVQDDERGLDGLDLFGEPGADRRDGGVGPEVDRRWGEQRRVAGGFERVDDVDQQSVEGNAAVGGGAFKAEAPLVNVVLAGIDDDGAPLDCAPVEGNLGADADGQHCRHYRFARAAMPPMTALQRAGSHWSTIHSRATGGRWAVSAAL